MGYISAEERFEVKEGVYILYNEGIYVEDLRYVAQPRIIEGGEITWDIIALMEK